MLTQLFLSGYRSVRYLNLDLQRVTLLVGANGSGKSNLYRAVRLLADAAAGTLSRSLVAEGGLPSVLTAIDEPHPCSSVTLGCTLDEWRYELQIGLTPAGPGTAFRLDPVVQAESLQLRTEGRPVMFLERSGVRTLVRDGDGRVVDYPHDLARSEAALGQLHDPAQFPELASLRQRMLAWRFYHQFRTDEQSALRQPQLGVFTPVLGHDGRDLAAALQTICEQEPGPFGEKAIDRWLERAFPGTQMSIVQNERAAFEVLLDVPRVSRPLRAAEFSDGQLRFLCLLAALSSPRPAELLVLNEPETSLHVDVLPVLAELIAAASAHSQIVVTTHARELADALAAAVGTQPFELELRDGQTRIVGRGRYE